MKLTLIERKAEVEGVETFIFESAEPLSWQAGQFGHWVLHHRPTDDRGSDRWFTISSAPFEKRPMITTRLAAEKGSTFKKALVELKPGDSIEISEVEGDFTVEDSERPFVFIAGGIGITPFHAILKQLDHDGEQIRGMLLYGNRDAAIPFQQEFDDIAKRHPEFTIHYIVAPEQIDEACIRQAVPDLAAPVFYVSGPEPMVESLGNLLKTMGVAADHLKQDWFPGYEGI